MRRRHHVAVALAALGGVLAMLLSVSLLTPSHAGAAGVQRRTVHLRVDGRARTFLLATPPHLGRPTRLVLVLHGLHQTSLRAEGFSGFDDVAADRGWLVAYPMGWQRSWNAGACCGAASRADIDDVQFLTAVIAAVERRHHVDKVYLAGFSNGAMMSYRFACARPDLVSAVAGVAGQLETPCHPASAVPVLDIHGLRDTLVPYAGQVHSAILGTSLSSTPETLAAWRLADSGKAPVRGVAVARAGHVWPVLSRNGFNATAAITDFFAAH